ncbi:MAG: hypothetical protein HS111_34785 [Kofleriaceae bacterium]|nr:hypothetical protein [Kofleriaceae bacterium]
MPNDYAFRDHDAASASTSSNPVGAPGKRTLTQSLVPMQRSLRDQQRAVVDFDDAAGDDVYDSRATVDARVTETPLTERQLRRARRKNPAWIERLKVSAQIFGTAEVESSAFALDVAAHQQRLGLAVDGIAGPKTVAAVAAEVTAVRAGGKRERGNAHGNGQREVHDFDAAIGDGFYDARATVEPVEPHDDPFGLHLLGDDSSRT